jgi:NAD(P)H dehydrogenase (quinone)
LAISTKDMGAIPIPSSTFSLFMLIKFLSIIQVNNDFTGLNCVTKIVIIYDSQTGNTQTMANAISEGAKKAGPVEVILKKVSESTKTDLLDADGVILGSPTHYGLISTNMKAFIDQTFVNQEMIWQQLAGKVGGAFTNSAGVASGGETTLLSLVVAMFIHGMIIPGRADDMHYGVALTGKPTDEGLAHCRELGRIVASLAIKLKQ